MNNQTKGQSLGRKLFLSTVMFLLKRRYRLVMIGEELLAKPGAKLVLLEHPAHIEPIILGVRAAQITDPVPVISEQFMSMPFFGDVLRSWNAVPVSDLKLGNRDPEVLTKMTQGMAKALEQGRTILLSPSGNIARSGYERIGNKQSTYTLMQQLPDPARVIGVRIYGFWGSMFSWAWEGKKPNFLHNALKAAFYLAVNLLFLMPKRTVTFEFVDITDAARTQATTDRWTFNQYLEDFYNANGPDPLTYIRHVWCWPLRKKAPTNLGE